MLRLHFTFLLVLIDHRLQGRVTGGAERHGERENVVAVHVRGDGDRRNGTVNKLGMCFGSDIGRPC